MQRRTFYALMGLCLTAGVVQDPDVKSKAAKCERAQKVMRHLAQNKAVKAAHVIINGDIALIGAEPHLTLSAYDAEHFKREIEQAVKRADKQIDYAMVTIAPDAVARIAKVVEA